MSSKKKWYFRKRIILPLILLLVCLLGPRLKFDKLDSSMPYINMELSELDNFIKEKESKIEGLKPNNEARIVWADSIRKTEYSVVYLHGYSASPMEGDGVHLPFAKRYGCNLFLARLQGHGTEGEDRFLDSTPQKWLDSAKEAIAIGRLMGEKVIVMSASTGGTLSTYLA
ncbi:MAG: alpha/beta hydrolase, partial [Saprospiraceae bacterium]